LEKSSHQSVGISIRWKNCLVQAVREKFMMCRVIQSTLHLSGISREVQCVPFL
jgi:hypothetical protein